MCFSKCDFQWFFFFYFDLGVVRTPFFQYDLTMSLILELLTQILSKSRDLLFSGRGDLDSSHELKYSSKTIEDSIF
jgi:hypothetical protein